jgi:hypothetical protein
LAEKIMNNSMIENAVFIPETSPSVYCKKLLFAIDV